MQAVACHACAAVTSPHANLTSRERAEAIVSEPRREAVRSNREFNRDL